jgi:hypothetical protein
MDNCIGYGNVSKYDSLRYDLFLDKTNNAYFYAHKQKYIIKLNNDIIKEININKRIWVTLSDKSPSQIKENNTIIFSSPYIRFLK